QWVESLDKLRAYQAEYMVPLHGRPVSGQDKVEEVLRITRDGIAYIHDQTVRWMNKGLTPDELVEKVKLPPHLAGYTPYLREYYGTVKHSVRQIYNGYLGWFQGDPVAL
ncbi:alkyl sulfatase dimerization domain-containing protein, partial [Klebsiella pneumoniae]